MSRNDGYFQRVRKLNKRPGKRNGSTLLEHDGGGVKKIRRAEKPDSKHRQQRSFSTGFTEFRLTGA